MATNIPPPEVLLEYAKKQLAKQLPPFVFNYFDWFIDKSSMDFSYLLRGTTKQVVRLVEPTSLRDFGRMDEAEAMGRVKTYYPQRQTLCVRFNIEPTMKEQKIVLDNAVGEIVKHLDPLKNVQDYEEMEAWILMIQQ